MQIRSALGVVANLRGCKATQAPPALGKASRLSLPNGLRGHNARDILARKARLEIDLNFMAVAAPAVMFAGISKGGFGSGAAFAGSAILALIIEPGLALGVMLPLLMLIDLAALGPFWGRWRWEESLVLILGGIPGVALGALFYTLVNADALRIMIGAIALLFVAWQMAQRQGWIARLRLGGSRWLGGFFGAISGFTSFVSHAGGPPAAIYMLGRGMHKTEYQATTVLVFWVINIAKFVPYAFLGLFTLETLWANVVLAPFAVLGAWLGVKAHFLVSERFFFALTYALLTVTGARLVWLGLT